MDNYLLMKVVLSKEMVVVVIVNMTCHFPGSLENVTCGEITKYIPKIFSLYLRFLFIDRHDCYQTKISS
jgi:hypothetical protein